MFLFECYFKASNLTVVTILLFLLTKPLQVSASVNSTSGVFLTTKRTNFSIENNINIYSKTELVYTTVNTFTGDNMTKIYKQRANQSASVPGWTSVFDHVTACCTLIGFVANVICYVTLKTYTDGFAPGIHLLLKVQSFIDAACCVFSTALLLAPPMWMTGIVWLDYVICHLWHGQAIYWGFVGMSIWNLVLVAIDPYKCVCQPFKYIQTDVKHWYLAMICIIFIWLYSFSAGVIMQVRMEDGVCVSKFILDSEIVARVMFGFAIAAFPLFYLGPTISLILLYGKVVYTMRKRQSDKSAPSSKSIKKAAKQLTRTALVVTLIFMLALGYDFTYYLLGYTGVLQYIMNSPAQKIGVLLAALNNCANPFVYMALMPNYRQHVKAKLLGCLRRKNKPVRSNEGSGIPTRSGHLPSRFSIDGGSIEEKTSGYMYNVT